MKLLLKEKCKSIVGMANINAQELQNFQMPLPPINLQNQFAQFMHATLHQKDELTNGLDILEKLFASLQARAFSGDLTPDTLDEVEVVAAGS